MSYKIYHNPKCSKSRQTLALLVLNHIEPEIIDYLQTPPTADELRNILELLQIDAFDLLRKGEAVFKEKYSGKNLTNDQWIEVMIKSPKLIERPIVITENSAIIGRPPERVLELL